MVFFAPLAALLFLSGLVPRSGDPVRVFVFSSARGAPEIVEIIDNGRVAIEKRLRKTKAFDLVESAADADVVIDLRAYWKREDQKLSFEARHIPPHGSTTVEKLTVEEHHHLLAVVTIRGVAREMTGVESKKGRGSVEGAAGNLLQQIERKLKEKPFDLVWRDQLFGPTSSSRPAPRRAEFSTWLRTRFMETQTSWSAVSLGSGKR